MSALNGKPKGFRLEDFLAKDFSTEYIVRPLLPAGGVGLLHGKGGHGKTQFAFALMNAIARGERFLGRYDCAEGNVLYLQFDMPESLFQERLRKALPGFSCPERLFVVPYPKAINICESHRQQQIQEIVAEYEPRLVIVDTLRKTHPYDENDNAVPSAVYEAWKEATGREAGVLIIHHDRKTFAANGGGSEDDAVESFRGARAWIDDSDLGIHLYKYNRKNDVKMDYSKLRCAPQDVMHLRLNPETLLIEPKAPETAREWAERLARPGMSRKELVRALEAQGISQTQAYDAAKWVEERMAAE